MTKLTKKKKIVGVNVTVCHFYHGEKKNRSHGQRQFMLMSQYPWMGRIMCDDDNGLLSWIDTSHYFYGVASKLHTVGDKQEVASKLFSKKLNYDLFYHKLH